MPRTPRHSILITIDGRFAPSVDRSRLATIARRVLAAEGVAAAELGVVITDDETVRDLNRRYAGRDEATDVLSFSLREGEEFVAAPDGVRRLGEVVISFPTAARQAGEHGLGVEAEMAHLLVHGTLHLLGYDHAEPQDERRMRAREEELLGRSRLHNRL